MRWSIIGLVAVAIVTALAAAALVGTLRADAWRASRTKLGLNPEVTFVVACTTIPANTMVERPALSTRTIPRDQVPAGAILDSAAVLGKITALPMAEGQAFTARCFITEGSGKRLAAALPKGKRAVSVTVTDAASLGGILYPGCIVDVLATFRAAGVQDVRDSVATTLLQGVQVLGVESETIVTTGEENKKDEGPPGVASSKGHQVTLLVDMRQAKALELAQELGSVSLALRNPQDEAAGDLQPVSLRAISGPNEATGQPEWAALEQRMEAALAKVTHASPAAAAAAGGGPTVATLQPPTIKPAMWEAMVIRGQEAETRTFPMPASRHVANEGD